MGLVFNLVQWEIAEDIFNREISKICYKNQSAEHSIQRLTFILNEMPRFKNRKFIKNIYNTLMVFIASGKREL